MKPKMSELLRAAAKDATRELNPPPGFYQQTGQQYWNSRCFSESEMTTIRLTESIFNALASVYETYEKADLE